MTIDLSPAETQVLLNQLGTSVLLTQELARKIAAHAQQLEAAQATKPAAAPRNGAARPLPVRDN